MCLRACIRVCVCVCVCLCGGQSGQQSRLLRRKGVSFTTGGGSGHCANQPSTDTPTHTHTARGGGPVLLMPAGRPDHSLPPQTHRGHGESWKRKGKTRREGDKGKNCGGRAETGQADKVESERDTETEADNDRWGENRERTTGRMRCRGKKMAANKWKEGKKDDWGVL